LLFWMNSPAGVAGREGGTALSDARVESIVFTDRPVRRRKDMADARQVCVYENGSVDRSPGALAICARLAAMKAQGKIGAGASMSVEGITGSLFHGKMVGEESVQKSSTTGVICEIEGQAWITGRHTFLIAGNDPFGHGFHVR
jgi:proline racemase